ncbi:MAG: EcsC family protein [Kastovskya adunca ATA6-11-RM4]|jgi:uncharacterized protein (DUF697 family)|nr:EcsC family protein [Kastovskya adunca ATA6-11-RM4]
MAVQSKEDSGTEKMNDAFTTVMRLSAYAAKTASEAVQSTTENFTSTATAVGETIGSVAHQLTEHGTKTVGEIATPIAENPMVKYAAKVPGINVLMAALGEVDVDKAQKEVDQLRQEYPLETPEQIAHRIMVDTAMKAGGVGLLTNFVPPLALTLFAVDLAAVTALQAEMVYRIAAAYGFPLKDPTRRGEVLAIFGLSVGGAGPLKVGMSFIELIPVVGAVAGASNNAALIYSLGYVTSRYYEKKISSAAQANATGSSNINHAQN